jgi:hypothetical protein
MGVGRRSTIGRSPALPPGVALITPLPPRPPIPVRQPRAGHPLAQPALLQEILRQAADLLVDQVVGLVDQADRDVGDHLVRFGSACGASVANVG